MTDYRNKIIHSDCPLDWTNRGGAGSRGEAGHPGSMSWRIHTRALFSLPIRASLNIRIDFLIFKNMRHKEL